MQFVWPWQDRSRRFSPLKASVFALMFVPAIWLAYDYRTGEFGIYPLSLGGLTFWSGLWATEVLLLALATISFLRPVWIGWPVGVMAVWIAVNVSVRIWRLYRRRRDASP